MVGNEKTAAHVLATRFQDALATQAGKVQPAEETRYALSDIHGCVAAFCEALRLVDLRHPESKLILCGDYLDSRHEHPEFLSAIRLFQKANENQVVALKGNHEASFLEGSEVTAFTDMATVSWLRHLPAYYETDTQIFVHAGIDEEAEDLWKQGTPDYFFYEKFPQTYGSFEKDIIAGHVATYEMCGENRVFWDGESHYYLDGSTETSGVVPVLAYEVRTGKYYTWVKEKDAWAKVPLSFTRIDL